MLRRRRLVIACVAVATCAGVLPVVFAALSSADVQPGVTQRASVADNGGQAATGGYESQLSGNGRWDVFASPDDLAGHGGGEMNIFARDLLNGHTVQISLGNSALTADPDSGDPSQPTKPDGPAPNGASTMPTISDNGRFVAFFTEASNIVPFVEPDGGDISSTLVVCDRDPSGALDSQGNPILDQPQNGVDAPDYACYPVFSSDENEGDSLVLDTRPRLSGDGTHLVWAQHDGQVYISTLGTPGGALQAPGAPTAVPINLPPIIVKIRRLDTATTTNNHPVLTADGSTVVFDSTTDPGNTAIIATTYPPGGGPPTSQQLDVCPVPDDVGDCAAGGYLGNLGAAEVSNPSTSADGKTVAFDFDSDTEFFAMVATITGTGAVSTRVASLDNSGDPADGGAPVLSGDGRYLAYDTTSADSDDGVHWSGNQQVVARDLVLDDQAIAANETPEPGALVTISVKDECDASVDETCASDGSADVPESIDNTGHKVAYDSFASDLVSGDTNAPTSSEGPPAGMDAFVRTWHPTIESENVQFPTTQIGQSSDANLSVGVFGFGPVTFGATEIIGGGDSADFTVLGSTCAGSTLHSGDNCTSSIQFTPTGTTTRTRTATVEVLDSDGAVAVTQTVRGFASVLGPGVAPGTTERTSVADDGTQGDQDSSESMISGNGRWEVFSSDSDLAGFRNGDQRNIYVRDLADPEHTIQLSLGTRLGDTPADPSRPLKIRGIQRLPNGDSFQPTISDNGRFVSFVTEATNIVPFDGLTDNIPDDDETYTIVVLDRDPSGKLDADGQPVLDQVVAGTDVPDYVYYPVASGSVDAEGINVDEDYRPNLSGDGSRITWVEDKQLGGTRARYATLSTPGGPLHAPNGYGYVPTTGLGNFNDPDGPDSQVTETADQFSPVLSDDGSIAAYWARACCSDPNAAVIETNLATTISTRMDVEPGGGGFVGDEANAFFNTIAISARPSGSGSRVAFGYEGTSGDDFSVYVADHVGNTVTSVLESKNNAGESDSGFDPALSGDGRYLAFTTDAPAMHSGLDRSSGGCLERADSETCQVVARDLVRDAQDLAAGQPWAPSELVSGEDPTLPQDCQTGVPPGQTCAGDHNSDSASLSFTGSEVGFDSFADDLVPGDTNQTPKNTPVQDTFVHTWRPTLTAAPLNFGPVQLGTHLDRTLTISIVDPPASGPRQFGPLSLGAITLTGTNVGDFAVTATTCVATKPLHEAENCAISIRFTPSALGLRTADVSAVFGVEGYPRTPANDPPLTRGITGIGARQPARTPQFSADPAVLDFGNQLPLKVPGKTLPLVVHNPGSATLVLSNVTVADTTRPGAHLDYTVNATDCLGGVPPGGSCTMTVTFRGHVIGNRDAVMVVTDNAPGGTNLVGLLANVPKPTVIANPGVISPGRVTQISGTGFAPNRRVDVGFVGVAPQVRARTNAHGVFTASLVVVSSGEYGPRMITAHTHNADPSISAQGPLLLVLGSLDNPNLVIRH